MPITIQAAHWDAPLALPEDLDWPDRHAGSLVRSTIAYSISTPAALVVEVSTDAHGLPITLRSWQSGPGMGWFTTAEVEAVLDYYRTEDAPMLLTLGDGGAGTLTYWVRWDRPAGGFEVQPSKRRQADRPRPSADVHFCVLHFITCPAPD
jgi:hypothetical protein